MRQFAHACTFRYRFLSLTFGSTSRAKGCDMSLAIIPSARRVRCIHSRSSNFSWISAQEAVSHIPTCGLYFPSIYMCTPHSPATDRHKNGGISSLFPASNFGSWSPSTSRPASLFSGRPRLVVCTLVSILIDGCAILAAAIRWSARTLPTTPRAFRETDWALDRFFGCGAGSDSDGEREISV